MSEQLITQEVLAQLAQRGGVEVPMAQLVAGGVTQKTLSYRVDTFQRYLVDHFLNSVRDLARLKSLLSMPKAREFPNSIPKVHAGTFLRSDEWRENSTRWPGHLRPGTFCSAGHPKSILKRRHFFSCYLGLSVKDDIKFIILCCSSDFKYFF